MTTSHHGRSARAGSRAKTDRPRKPSKIQPILLDRLAHALSAHGIEMKRTDLLQVAAAAFGYHNANEFSAANLTVQPATAIARATLPDGASMIVLRDPLANTAYGVDQSFVEQVVAEERRESFGVSPYGHVLDLSHLPDLDLEALGTTRPPAGATLHIAVCEYRHGSAGYVGLTQDDLYAQIAGFCSEYWHEVERRAGPMTDYATDKELVEAYYENNDRETLYVEEATLPTVAPHPNGVPTPAYVEEHEVFRKMDHRAWKAMTQEALDYRAWVSTKVLEAAARPPERRWQTASQLANLAPNTAVIIDIHIREGERISVAPGTLGRVKTITSYGGMTDIEVKFSQGYTLIFTDGQRGGLFPFYPATCDVPGVEEIQNFWLTADHAAHPVYGLKAGDMMTTYAAIPANPPIPVATTIRLTEMVVTDAQVRLDLRYGENAFSLTADRHRGVFPMTMQQSRRHSLILHPEEEWHEAVAQRATNVSYATWSSERRTHKIHLKEKWLTGDEVRNLRPGQALTICIHGSGTGFNDETGETFEGTYAPGDIVIVDTVHVLPTGDGGKDHLVLDCQTENGIPVIVALRSDYMPVSYAPVDAEAVVISKKTHLVADHAGTYLLTTGEKVHTGSGDPLTVVGVAETQPLHAEGLLLFKAEDDIVYITRYRGRWELYPASQITHDQLRKIGRPDIDEEIVFDGVDCHIEAADFSANQPLAASGIIVFTDQYREPHLCQRDGDHWVIVQPHELTDAQAKAVDGLI